MSTFDPLLFRQQFPAIHPQEIYLDSAATALKPRVLVETLQRYYADNGATVHRSQHPSALQTTQQFEEARELAAHFLGAAEQQEIVWTHGTTEAINLVAQSYARPRLQPGDEILISEAEHHANLIPWLMVAEQTGAVIKLLPLAANRLPDIANIGNYLTPKTAILALGQMSNVTGGSPDLHAAIQQAHRYGAIVVVDGAQGVVHHPINVQALDIDFYAFSAHKLYGPTGIGLLYGKKALLEQMPPWIGGGKMLTAASFSCFTPQEIPFRFEAGTPHIAGVLGMHTIFTWLKEWDWPTAERYACSLATLAEQKLATLPGFCSYRVGESSLLAFNYQGIHHQDLVTLLAEQGIALRAGQHCAHPLLHALGVNGTVRASFAPYNNEEEVEKLYQAIRYALSLLREEE